MRFWSMSPPFLTLISFTLMRYWKTKKQEIYFSIKYNHFHHFKDIKYVPHLTHLKLKEASLLLHLFCDLSSANLRSDQSVLFGMFALFFLNLISVKKTEIIFFLLLQP